MDYMFQTILAFSKVKPAYTANEIIVHSMAEKISKTNFGEKYDSMVLDMLLAEAVHLMQSEKIAKILSQAEEAALASNGFNSVSVSIPADEKALADESWHRISSPFWLRNSKTYKTGDTVIEVSDALDVLIARWEAADLAAKDGTADERCRKLMEEMKLQFPELGLSFGYVGNCDLWGKKWDDRRWKFFTHLREDRNGNQYSVSFGGVSTGRLGRLADQAEEMLQAWCQETSDKLAQQVYRKVA